MDKEDFKFPDEVPVNTKEEKVDFEIEDNDTEVEVVDDTPEVDRGRKPLDRPVNDPTDDELQDYSEKVRARIKELTHARHDERRAKETLERQHNEAIRAAQALVDENKKLKEQLTQGQTGFISQAQKLAEVEVEKAKAALKAAHEAGDTEAFVDAQTKLNEAVFNQQRVKAFKPPLQRAAEPDNVSAQQAAPTTPVQQPDAKFVAWKQKNPWFGEDDEMTSLAFGLHNKLAKTGMTLGSDEYYSVIDRRMRQVFPDKFESPVDRSETPTRKPATVVAPSSRATSAKKVVLTQSQLSTAKRLGLTPQQYAQAVAELTRNENA